MDAFNFWQKWLLGVSIFLVAFGGVLAAFPQSAPMDLAFNSQIDPVFWSDGNLPPEAAAFQSWIYGVLGSVVCGWGIVMAFVVHHPFRERRRWAWNSLAAGIVVWFIMDTTLSAIHHALFNVVFNTVLFGLIIVPLACTRKQFEA